MNLIIKNYILTELIVSSIPVVFNLSQIIDKLLETSFTKNMFADRIKTKTHHVVIFSEENGMSSSNFLIIKSRGILKPWKIMDKNDMPEVLANEIFDLSCAVKRRKVLVEKILSLRAFW